ncbi:S-layer homology domain-containing protein [Petrocella sp. FN5]|uniref:S-layer homology domain-containing protein n=1 Tax=Petrocella sp. FN5 TaxID=3032002 RepID=UPI0023DB76FA|nr:S-layer homology domain-containing protein [Petrocella sp. FN5]MDF1618423.1 S-layer homology domain-containing protein [Petrocella sp. FN5]
MIKKIILFLLCLSLITSVSTAATATSNYNSASSWALDELAKADQAGLLPDIMKDGPFQFSDNISRLDFSKAIILFYDQLGGTQDLPTTNPFKDVTDPKIIKAYHAGIIKGKSEDVFMPEDVLTRQEMCVMIVRTLDAVGTTNYQARVGFQKAFQDIEHISDWAIEAVESMNAHRIINGTSDRLLSPKDHLTGEQAIIMLYRAFDKFEKPMGDEDKKLIRVGDIKSAEIDKISENWDEGLIQKSIEMGFPSIKERPEEKKTNSLDRDVIQFDDTLSGLDLFKSITHAGFDSITVDYMSKHSKWLMFADDYDYIYSEETTTVHLKNEDFYEVTRSDQYPKYDRYYRRDHGIYYVVTELEMESIGRASYPSIIDNKDVPRHNPIVFGSKDYFVDCLVTELKGEAVIYLERLMSRDEENKLVKEWISIKDGIVIKSYTFSEDGAVEKEMEALSIRYEEIEDSVFVEPQDIAYDDITFLIYSYMNEPLIDFQDAISNTFIEEPFILDLINKKNSKNILKMHSSGKAMNQIAITSEVKNHKGETLEIIEFHDGEYFNTVVPEKRVVEKYKTSVSDMKLFDFHSLGFRGRRETEKKIIYTFQDMGKGSVSDLITFYEYSIDKESGRFVEIASFFKESPIGEEVEGFRQEYVVTNLKKGNMAIFEIPKDYEVVQHDWHYDGEHAPIWWE